MTKDELLEQLREMHHERDGDYEINHLKADRLLLEYINDPEITAAFDDVGKWYA